MKYEYKIISASRHLNNKQLNEFGEKGWELVSIVTAPEMNQKESLQMHTFKRLITN